MLTGAGFCDDALRAITFLHAVRYSLYGMTNGYVLASCNRDAEARAVAADLERQYSQLPLAPLLLAAVYAGLGEKDAAFARLEEAYRTKAPRLWDLKAHRDFIPLRSDPRWSDLVHRLKLG